MLPLYTNVKTCNIDNVPSLAQLKAINHTLEREKVSTGHIHKEIRNEVQVGKKVGKEVGKSIVKINSQAQQLIEKYDQEKEKYEKLSLLVEHLEQQIYQSKLEKYEDLKNKIETDQLEEQSNILRSREKQLDKILDKANNARYEITNKIDTIRALRSERSVFSTLFDKLQRELCSLEHCYKVLVIDRSANEHEYRQKVKEFKKDELTILKQQEKIIGKPNNEGGQPKRRNTQDIQIYRQSTFDTKNTDSRELILYEKKKTECEKNVDINSKSQRVQLNEFQRQVKQIFNDFGITRLQQLPTDLDQIQLDNRLALEQINSIQQEINELMVKTHRIDHHIKCQQLREIEKTQWNPQIKININKIINCIQEEKEELDHFHSRLLEMQRLKLLNLQQPDQECTSQEQSLRLAMAELEYLLTISTSATRRKQSQSRSPEMKRLSSLMAAYRSDNSHLTICEQEELLELAKKNLKKTMEEKQ